jgi:hypothetical protein
MKTKTLLIAAAALAAGIISSQAQTPVYSQNIVGYVNQIYSPGYANVSNPLDNGVANTLTNLFPNPVGALDGTLVYTWNGVGYTIYTIDSSFPTGVADFGDSVGQVAPVIAPGELIYYFNNTGLAISNTVVGTVHVDAIATGTNIVGVTTNVLTPGYNFVSSKISVGGGVSSSIGLTNPGGVLDGTLIYIPNINGSGTFLGYTIRTIDSSFSTGFADFGDSVQEPEPIIPVGTGFIFFNNLGANYNWVQSL